MKVLAWTVVLGYGAGFPLYLGWQVTSLVTLEGREGGQPLEIGGSSLAKLEGKAYNPL